MARTKTRSATVQERTHCIVIYVPKGQEPRIDFLREEVDGQKTTNLGVKKSLTWQELRQHAAFDTFRAATGITTASAFRNAMRDLSDTLCADT